MEEALTNVVGFPITPCKCPVCGHCFDRTDSIGDAGAPKPGDITLCIDCGAVLHFKNDMTVAELPDLGLLDDDYREYILKMQRKLREFHRKRRPS